MKSFLRLRSKRLAGLVAGLVVAAVLAVPADAMQDASDVAADVAAEVAGEVASWRELLEIDLGHIVAEQGPAALAADPALAGDGEALGLVARALYDAGREDESRALLDAARPRAGTESWIALERARQMLERDELREVVELLKARPAEQAASGEVRDPVRYPEAALCWLYVGRALNRAGRGSDSRPFLLRFTELAPLARETPSAWHMLAIEAFSRREVELAESYQQRGRELALWHTFYKTRRIQARESPGDPLPHVGLARLWLQFNRNERAQTELELALGLGLGQDSAETWALLAETRRKLGLEAEALAAYDQALELDPEQLLVRTNRALLHKSAGRSALARADLELVVESDDGSDPRIAVAYLMLARLVLAAGDEQAAKELYRTYVDRGGSEPLGE